MGMYLPPFTLLKSVLILSQVNKEAYGKNDLWKIMLFKVFCESKHDLPNQITFTVCLGTFQVGFPHHITPFLLIVFPVIGCQVLVCQ